MDYSNIPSCALYRHGTVIVRLKMEVSCDCDETNVWPARGCAEPMHRLDKCEQCSRTRANRRYSDCDSVVDKCRPYRASAARSRYVNVYAAVCLLLLVSGLTKPSSALPHRSRSMDRDRRLSDQENPFWANPCDYATIPSSGSIEYGSNLAQNVATLARNTLNIAEKYKDELAQKIHQYDNFTLLLDNWKSYKWMYKWDSKDIVPPEKVFGSSMSEEYLANLMSKIDTALPSMYRGMKMVLAGLHAISKELPGIDNESLRQKLYSTSLGVRSVACSLHDVMISRKLDIAPLLDSEIPRLELKTRAEDTFLIYRDTLIYLSYLEEVFEMMSNGS